MIPNQKIKINPKRGLNQKYKQKYYELGYTQIYDVDELWVDIKDLSHSSHKEITIICDYCGKSFSAQYNTYLKNKEISIIHKDCCIDCVSLKRKEVFNLKYGVDSAMQIESTKKKRDDTFLKKYGTTNISSVEEIKNKKMNTFIHKYGVKNFSQTSEYREKFEKTCLEKYGVKSPFQSEVVREKIKTTNLSRYGVENASKNPEVVQKIIKSQQEHFNCKTSNMQIDLFNMIVDLGYDAYLNYIESNLILDIVVFLEDKKIDIEYDGWYWHRNKQKDIARNSVLLNLGWNIIRVQSGNYLPTKDELQNCINNVIKENKHIQFIKLNDWIKHNENY